MTARIECVGNAAAAGDSATRPDELPRPTSPPQPQPSTAMESVAAASATATRLENAERQMAKMRLDLGELMVVYDDMQVATTKCLDILMEPRSLNCGTVRDVRFNNEN